jgi:hypothetical protein
VAGFDPATFWMLTPRFFLIYMQGAADRLKNQQQHDVAMVHLGAALQRAKKMPKLADLLSNKPPPTTSEVFAHLRSLRDELPKRTWSEWRNQ